MLSFKVRHLAAVARRSALAWAMAVAGLSCTRSLTLEVRDAATRRPLPDAQVTRYGHITDLLFGSSQQAVVVGTTDLGGRIRVPGLDGRLVHELHVTKAGYQPASIF